jgi:hypothetical protein
VSATFAEIAVGFARKPRLEFSNWFDDQLGLPEEIVKPAARNGISAPVDNYCGFHVIDRRNATAAGLSNCLCV